MDVMYTQKGNIIQPDRVKNKMTGKFENKKYVATFKGSCHAGTGSSNIEEPSANSRLKTHFDNESRQADIDEKKRAARTKYLDDLAEIDKELDAKKAVEANADKEAKAERQRQAKIQKEKEQEAEFQETAKEMKSRSIGKNPLIMSEGDYHAQKEQAEDKANIQRLVDEAEQKTGTEIIDNAIAESQAKYDEMYPDQ